MTGAAPDRRLVDLGDAGVLVEVGGLPDVLALFAALERDRRQGLAPIVEDVVPAERTLLVRFDPSVTDVGDVRRWLLRTKPVPGRPVDAGLVEVPVRYDGADLDDVGRLTGLGARGVVAAHTGRDWTVAFTGFAPGFGYLVDGDPRLRVPRLATPRTRVPAGSVALAGAYSGVYPRSSPGGWRLLGTTAVPVWDVDRDPPALLRPGLSVRFVAVP